MNYHLPNQNQIYPNIIQHPFYPNAGSQFIQHQPSYIIVYQPQYVQNTQINDLQQLTYKNLNSLPKYQDLTTLNFKDSILNHQQAYPQQTSFQSIKGNMNTFPEFTQQNQQCTQQSPQQVIPELSSFQEQQNSFSTQILQEYQFGQNDAQQIKNAMALSIEQNQSNKKSQRYTLNSQTTQQNCQLNFNIENASNQEDQLEDINSIEEIQMGRAKNNRQQQLKKQRFSSQKESNDCEINIQSVQPRMDQLNDQKFHSTKQIKNFNMEIQNVSCFESYQKQQEVLQQNTSQSVSSFSSLQQSDNYQNNYELKQQYQQTTLSQNPIKSQNSQIKNQEKKCKFRSVPCDTLIQMQLENQINLQIDQQIMHSQNNTIKKPTKLNQTKQSLEIEGCDSHQIKEQEILSYNEDCNEQKNNNAQSRIIKKLIQKLPCSENKILQKFKLKDALKIIKSSVFNQRKEIIFEQKSQLPFKLKQSVIKNDEIVFAQIKESRRNNRSQNKKNDDLKDFSDKIYDEQEDKTSSTSSSKNLDNQASLNQQQPDTKKQKVTSKFHNLKKLFMYKLVATFNLSNMIELGVAECVREALLKLIVKFKLSAKKSEEFNRKTEFFSQAHYNALFLYLNPQTISQLAKNKFEVYLHKIIFSIDLEKIVEYYKSPINSQNNKNCNLFSIEIENEEKNNCYRNNCECCFEEKIQYINILKRFCYQIVKNSNMFGVISNKSDSTNQENNDQMSEYQFNQNPDKQFNEQENMRMAYTYRALQGISSLSKGIFVKKF